MNSNTDTELRVAAFVMLMKTNPCSSLVLMQKRLDRDPDYEFKSFVVSYMKNVLENQEPICQQW